MALIDEEPPNVLPRGTGVMRLSQ
jgi:hypothetical protein